MSCLGDPAARGALHFACDCYRDRMHKLERIARAAASLIVLMGKYTDRFMDCEEFNEYQAAIGALRPPAEKYSRLANDT